MSGIPEARPHTSDQPEADAPHTLQEAADPAEPIAEPGATQQGEAESATITPSESFFESYAQQLLSPPAPRYPNFFDVFVLAVLLFLNWFVSGLFLATALHFHLWGVSTTKQALNDIHYTLGAQVVWYLMAFAECFALFPIMWRTPYFAALEWNAKAAFRKRWRLLTAAFACFVLAIADGILLPGPPDTPIDQVFRMPGAAWLLFVFGVTMAPFFEEMAFRGFLLPAFNTAADWTAQRLLHVPAPHPDLDGRTHWSVGAMIVGSVLTSIPFALMHAVQTGWSLGPFLLLVCVSMVLCWVRLSTRSLAASTLVHSSYNLLLFLLMIAGTGGFKHFERI
jgi:membrane protease YdiL (CAAX protease family)